MRPKTIAVLAVILILTLALTGCTTNQPSATPAVPSEPTPASTPVAEPTQAATADQTDAEDREEEEPATGFKIGHIMPDFSLPLTTGGTFTLSENLGKPVFINLFATWCPPCVAEMPDIQKLYDELGEDVTFLIIDVGEDAATAQGFMDDNGYSLPTAYDENGAPFGSGYYIQFIPQTFVLKPDGTISDFIGGGSSYDKFMTAIEEAMAP